ncbi:MAG: ABC transporter ATP-binding protein, partial [Nitrospirota bacterium]
MGTKLYQVSDVGFRYEYDWILRDISFQIEEGEFLGLIGPNGSGKTPLLKLLSRLLSPGEGTITFKERPLDSWNHRELAREVGVVPQEISIVYPLTVL